MERESHVSQTCEIQSGLPAAFLSTPKSAIPIYSLILKAVSMLTLHESGDELKTTNEAGERFHGD